MKKLFALVLTLILVFNAVAALAAKPQLGSPFSFSSDDYMNIMSQLAEATGLSFTWEAQPRDTFGYPMYVAANDAGTVYVSVHDINGARGIEVDAFANDLNNMDALATEFGNALAVVTLAVCYLEKGDLSDELMDTLTAEAEQLVAFMDNLPDDATYGEQVGSLCGYPAYVSVTVDQSNGTATLVFTILSTDGAFLAD